MKTYETPEPRPDLNVGVKWFEQKLGNWTLLLVFKSAILVIQLNFILAILVIQLNLILVILIISSRMLVHFLKCKLKFDFSF